MKTKVSPLLASLVTALDDIRSTLGIFSDSDVETLQGSDLGRQLFLNTERKLRAIPETLQRAKAEIPSYVRLAQAERGEGSTLPQDFVTDPRAEDQQPASQRKVQPDAWL